MCSLSAVNHRRGPGASHPGLRTRHPPVWEASSHRAGDRSAGARAALPRPPGSRRAGGGSLASVRLRGGNRRGAPSQPARERPAEPVVGQGTRTLTTPANPRRGFRERVIEQAVRRSRSCTIAPVRDALPVLLWGTNLGTADVCPRAPTSAHSWSSTNPRGCVAWRHRASTTAGSWTAAGPGRRRRRLCQCSSRSRPDVAFRRRGAADTIVRPRLRRRMVDGTKPADEESHDHNLRATSHPGRPSGPQHSRGRGIRRPHHRVTARAPRDSNPNPPACISLLRSAHSRCGATSAVSRHLPPPAHGMTSGPPPSQEYLRREIIAAALIDVQRRQAGM